MDAIPTVMRAIDPEQPGGPEVLRIVERPVPSSDVDGERASSTQPYPSKPAALSPQGVTLDDAFDDFAWSAAA